VGVGVGSGVGVGACCGAEVGGATVGVAVGGGDVASDRVGAGIEVGFVVGVGFGAGRPAVDRVGSAIEGRGDCESDGSGAADPVAVGAERVGSATLGRADESGPPPPLPHALRPRASSPDRSTTRRSPVTPAGCRPIPPPASPCSEEMIGDRISRWPPHVDRGLHATTGHPQDADAGSPLPYGASVHPPGRTWHTAGRSRLRIDGGAEPSRASPFDRASTAEERESDG
jgi:hypothetical protein